METSVIARRWVAAGLGAVAVAVVAFALSRSGSPPIEAWSRLGTDDVHTLAVVGDDPSRILFGHHGGILASTDGGRSWRALSTRADAMNLGVAPGGSIVIAGHDVLVETRDGGRSWQDVPADLPSLDIHGFARDPGNPARMWAYLATGGLWETQDGGRRWTRVLQENVALPVAVMTPTGTRLYGVTAQGLVGSDDSGRTWRGVATPELYPMTSLAAAPGGSVLVASGLDRLARSDDGGATWSDLPFVGQPAAVALANGGRTVMLMSRTTAFFRSDDGGRTWPAP